MSFQIGDNITCPGFGVGLITNIIEKEIAGEVTSYYDILLTRSGQTVLLPTSSEDLFIQKVDDTLNYGQFNLGNAGDFKSLYSLQL